MLIRLAVLLAGALLLGALGAAQEPEPPGTLYNGIRLPSPWPPRLPGFPTSVEKDPVTPPYQLHFYVSGRAGQPGNSKAGLCTTGLATLRRDGFASMDAGEEGGTLTTRPVQFRGRHLFVNVDTPAGELRVEVLDGRGEVVAAFSRLHCLPLRVDRTLQQVVWEGEKDLSSLAGKPVRFRFHLRKGSLYSFWVTPDASGASHGYVAAGGPGFTGPTDTVGAAAQRRP